MTKIIRSIVVALVVTVGALTTTGAGDERGREDRSHKLSTPSAQKRPTHLPKVFGVVLNWRAAAALDMPRSTTARTISSRPSGSGELLMSVLRSSANR